MTLKTNPSLLFLFVILCVCCTGTNNTSTILDKIEHHIYAHRDTALLLLETLSPHYMDGEELARYNTLVYRINMRNCNEAEGDSLLSMPEKYYRNIGDERNLVEVLLLKGNNTMRHENYQTAEKYYCDALDIWIALNDSGGISRTYNGMSWLAHWLQKKDSVLILAQKALQYAPENSRWNSLLYLGDLHADRKEFEKAEYYYRQACESSDNRTLYQRTRSNLIQLYADAGMHEKAFLHLDSFLLTKKGRYETAYTMLAKANIWKGIHQFDSAYYYYTLASQSVNSFVATEAYKQLAYINAQQADYGTASNLLLTFESLWNDEAMRIESKHMRVQYEEMKLRNELNETKLAKKNRELYLLLFSVIVILCLIGGYILYLRNKRSKEEQWLKEQANLLEKENRLLKQAEELSILREKEANLRETLFKKMSVFHKIPSLDNNPDKERPEENRIVLSEKDWEEIVQIVDSNYNDFAQRLKKQFPSLTAKDIRFCCLVKINVTLKDLSDIYCVSKAAITKKKFRIKTEKIGFRDEDKNLDDFLNSF